MYDLADFSLADMVRCTAILRKIGTGANCMEAVANRIVRHLYEHLLEAEARRPACPLIRLFKTHPFGELDEDSRRFAATLATEGPLRTDTHCLTLLASAGDRPEWNQRHQSKQYKAVPVTGLNFRDQFPMFSQLFTQFGIDPAAAWAPDRDLLLDHNERTFGVFHVPVAVGSGYVPAQDRFVIPCGIRSVVGVGGLLPTASVFALELFSRVPISREQAELFRTIALAIKLALLPFDGKAVLSPSPPIPCEERL